MRIDASILTLLALASLMACQAGPGLNAGFALDPIGAVAPGPSRTDPVVPASAPSPATGAAAPMGRGGGAALPAPLPPGPVTGLVSDAAGRPLEGASVVGGGTQTLTGPDGSFSLGVLAPGTIVTASLEGYASASSGPPYQLALARQTAEPGAPFGLSGMLEPPLAGAVVIYADGEGTRAETRSNADGSFSLAVQPADGTAAAGVVVAYDQLALTGVTRFGLLQAAPAARCGAAPAGSAGEPVLVKMFAASGALRLAPVGTPALSPAETSLGVSSPGGISVPLVGASGVWALQVPTFDLPGFSWVVGMRAETPDGAGYSVVEHVDPRPGSTWKPGFLALPKLEPPGKGKGKGLLKWQHAFKKGAVALYKPGQGVPAWEQIVSDGTAELPDSFATDTPYELEVQVWDAQEVPRPSHPGGARQDRRYAGLRTLWMPE